MQYYAQTETPEETMNIGFKIGSALKGGEVLKLSSDLGGGKTTFVKGIAQGLGVDETVQSPTFIINAQYNCADDLQLHHYDFYRLQDLGLMQEQLNDSLDDPKAITIMEWGDSADTVQAGAITEIKISKDATNDTVRGFTFYVPKEHIHILKNLETKE